MRRVIALLAGSAGFLMFTIAAQCAGTSFAADDTSDLWDIKQGCQITTNSGVLASSDIRNMFGGSYGKTEPLPGGYRVIFKDGFSDGYKHWVEWRTSKPILLSRFTLYLGNDSPPGAHRSIKEFNLYASQSVGKWGAPIFSRTDFKHPYGPKDYAMEYTFKKEIAAQYFRAEFIQYDGDPGAQGPRIMELNGYGKVSSGR